MKDARRTTLGDAFELIRFARFHIETAFKEWSEEPGNAGCAMPWSFRIGTAKDLELGDGDEITLDVDFGDSGGESPEDVEKKLRPLLIALGIQSVYTRRLHDFPCDVEAAHLNDDEAARRAAQVAELERWIDAAAADAKDCRHGHRTCDTCGWYRGFDRRLFLINSRGVDNESR